MAERITVLSVLSALLTYPGAELVAAAPEIAPALAADGLLEPGVRAGLQPLIDSLARDDLYDLQEAYVDLFDRSRRLSLHLFEHVHGESRDRGQAMVDLAALYEKGGLVLGSDELPDYLPAFLEYLSTRPLAEARGLLGEIDHILALLEERLQGRGAPYAPVFTALRGIGGLARPDAGTTVETEAEAPVNDLAALDAEWEETQVTFGPGDAMGGCSVDRFRTQLRAARRDVRHTAA